METSKSLNELAEVVGGYVTGTAQTAISDVTHDSRQVGEGTLFVAIPGAIHDGHAFAREAQAAGASALCVEHRLDLSIPQLVVASTRRIVGELASEVHGNPSRAIDVIGVTGTNGKTTVTHFVESIFSGNGVPVGLVGTVGSRVVGREVPSVRTTPEATDFQRLLASMRDAGAEKVAVEVSSHALELERVRSTRFAVAGFTNLSQDHLDFHSTMEAYRAAKERLFSEYEVDTAVFNIDDPVGSEMSGAYDRSQIRVGIEADFSASELESSESGTRFLLEAPGYNGMVDAPVHGEFNVANLTFALACCYASGLDIDDGVNAISELVAVPGRFEVVSGPEEPLVIVDYAHTPHGIALAVDAGRRIASGRLIVVVGAGGDRDRAKRAPMGAAASGADLVIVTSDNPRSEDPGEIVDQVLEGVTSARVRQPERDRAIAEAIGAAEKGDVVLLLGKGHESGQEINGTVVPFDDREVARSELERLRRSANFDNDSGSMAP